MRDPPPVLYRGCGVTVCLLAARIRRDLQARKAAARVAEQPPARTPRLAAGPDETEQPWRCPVRTGATRLVFVRRGCDERSRSRARELGEHQSRATFSVSV